MRWSFTDTHVRKFMPYCSIWDQNEPSPNKILVKVEHINVLFAFRYNPKTGVFNTTQIQHLFIESILFFCRHNDRCDSAWVGDSARCRGTKRRRGSSNISRMEGKLVVLERTDSVQTILNRLLWQFFLQIKISNFKMNSLFVWLFVQVLKLCNFHCRFPQFVACGSDRLLRIKTAVFVHFLRVWWVTSLWC